MKNRLKEKITLMLTAGGGLTLSLQCADPQLEKQLQELAAVPVPAKLAQGFIAMCYVTARKDPNRTEAYSCKECGRKTVYRATDDCFSVLWKLPDMRKHFSAWRKLGLNVHLDESDFCAQCSAQKHAQHPSTPPKKPELYLVITHADGSVHRAVVVHEDLLMLNAFFRKKTIYKDSCDKEYALKNDILRLRKLLNLPKTQPPPKIFP